MWKLRVKTSIYILGLAAGLVLVEWVLKYAVAGSVISVENSALTQRVKRDELFNSLFRG
jgi:hypothetical protein